MSSEAQKEIQWPVCGENFSKNNEGVASSKTDGACVAKRGREERISVKRKTKRQKKNGDVGGGSGAVEGDFLRHRICKTE
jgi:hypothetical protein